MKVAYIVFAFAMGLLVPFQAIINSRLSTLIQSNISAALISFTGGFLVFLTLNLLLPIPFPSPSKLLSLPPYVLIGGLIGSVFVLSAIMIVPKLGSMGFVALIVTGQLVMSLTMDHFGILGLPVNSINPMRVLGALLLLGGAGLILKY
ncbi:DMT family transporter [Halobacteriovorax sp. GB3]|uniref:DMT family transporter n=1 Tax=Halobacteriovorax sp. GB3 TaxID=2719615 RepID=UPI0023614744|nr:DMT family transporter [Halobacteriovorax sp. GB3]MDD0852065.1 DMT family transporter [Halobacteriovorax sp. GB3]